ATRESNVTFGSRTPSDGAAEVALAGAPRSRRGCSRRWMLSTWALRCSRPGRSGAGAAEHLGEVIGRAHHGGGVQSAGLAGDPLDRPGDAERGDHPAIGPAHRRRDRAHARLALSDGLRPAAPTYGRELSGGETRPEKSAMQTVRLLPGQQDLRG